MLIPLLVQALKGLGRSLQRIGAFLGLIILIGIIALIVAVPLWYFSSNFTGGYTVFVVALIAAGVLAALIGRLVRLAREPGALRVYLNGTLLPILKKTAVVVASIAVIYAIAFLLSRRHIAAAVLSGAAWLLLLGLLKYGRGAKR